MSQACFPSSVHQHLHKCVNPCNGKKKEDCFSKPFFQREGTKRLYISYAVIRKLAACILCFWQNVTFTKPFAIGSFWLTPPLRKSLQEYTKLGDTHPRVQERIKKVDPAEYSNMANPNTFSRCVFYFSTGIFQLIVCSSS